MIILLFNRNITSDNQIIIDLTVELIKILLNFELNQNRIYKDILILMLLKNH